MSSTDIRPATFWAMVSASLAEGGLLAFASVRSVSRSVVGGVLQVRVAWRRSLWTLDRIAESLPSSIPRVLIPRVFADALDRIAEEQHAEHVETVVPEVVVAERSRLSRDDLWVKAIAVLEQSDGSVRNVSRNHAMAEEKVDSAEYELNKLLGDLSGYMSAPVRRRTARVHHLPVRRAGSGAVRDLPGLERPESLSAALETAADEMRDAMLPADVAARENGKPKDVGGLRVVA